MSFSRSSEAPPILSNAETDSEVARPRPEDGGVGERNIKMMTITSQIGMPDRLNQRVGEGRREYER